MGMPAQKPGKSRQDYETPGEFLREVKRLFGPLTVDLAASVTNTKAPMMFDEGMNSLARDWSVLPGNLWLNPPFGDIEPWAEKCKTTKRTTRGERILLLVPASIGSEWFRKHVHGHAMVLALNPRLSFDGKNPFPKDCMLCVYGETPGFDVWRWK